jgi:signal transduction histidine kinase
MTNYEIISCLSILPIINLSDIKIPSDGVQIPTPNFCKKNFDKNALCKEHYASLSIPVGDIGTLTQCPHGFCTLAFNAGQIPVAITSIIPYPRMGGKKEQHQARELKDHKVSALRVEELARSIQKVASGIDVLESNAIKGHSMALHEIRKLNRTVKQTAERLCRSQSPEQPDQADRQLVSIWKSADLMSTQFDIIELLANEDLANLPCKNETEVYRLVDKCVRIYQSPDSRIVLNSQYGYSEKILICDKTFPIIPTVLIENALKYSEHGSKINVDIYNKNNKCVLQVSNYTRSTSTLAKSLFEKGRRGSSEGEGSGHGLYLAQLVAKQHNTKIEMESKKESIDKISCIFRVEFPLL